MKTTILTLTLALLLFSTDAIAGTTCTISSDGGTVYCEDSLDKYM